MTSFGDRDKLDPHADTSEYSEWKCSKCHTKWNGPELKHCPLDECDGKGIRVERGDKRI